MSKVRGNAPPGSSSIPTVRRPLRETIHSLLSRLIVSQLTFVDFLEALARLAITIPLPSDKDMQDAQVSFAGYGGALPLVSGFTIPIGSLSLGRLRIEVWNTSCDRVESPLNTSER